MTVQSEYYRQIMALVVGALLFVLIIYTLEKTGVPRIYSIGLSSVFALATYVVGTFPAGTTRAERFLVADRNTRRDVSALATVSFIGFPLVILGGGAMYFQRPGFLVTMAIAISGALTLKSLLVSRQFNAFRAADISEMLLVRFNNTLPARLFASANAIAGFILVACGVAAASLLVSWFFGLGAAVAMFTVVLLCFLTAALGGIGSVTRLAAVSTVLLLLGLNIPLLAHTLVEHGFPVGHLTAGVSAIQPAVELEKQLSSLGIPLIGEQINNTSSILSWSSGNQIFAGLIVLFAGASLPSLVHHSATNHDDESAGIATRRGLLYAGLATASIFALLAFTKIGFYQSVLGLVPSEAKVEAPFLYSWGDREIHLVELCGANLAAANDVLTACPDGIDHIINIPDFSLNGALLLAAAPDIAAQPFAFTALLTVSLIAVLISFTSAALLATANNLVTAFYASLAGKVASGRVFMVRLSLIFSLAFSVWLLLQVIHDFGSAFLFAMSVSCATAVPALAGVFYLKRCTSAAVSLSMGIGFAISVLYYVLATYGIDFIAGTGDELTVQFPAMSSPLPPELGAVFSLPVALGVLILTSALSRSGKPVPDALDVDGGNSL